MKRIFIQKKKKSPTVLENEAIKWPQVPSARLNVRRVPVMAGTCPFTWQPIVIIGCKLHIKSLIFYTFSSEI